LTSSEFFLAHQSISAPLFNVFDPLVTLHMRLELLPGFSATDSAHADLSSVILLFSSRSVLEGINWRYLDSLFEISSPKSSSDLVGDWLSADSLRH
jgi:hypothetical protein